MEKDYKAEFAILKKIQKPLSFQNLKIPKPNDHQLLIKTRQYSSNRNIDLSPHGSGVVRIDGNVDIQTGEIVLKNGGSVSNIKFYCESIYTHLLLI